jgi:hypothetical protein
MTPSKEGQCEKGKSRVQELRAQEQNAHIKMLITHEGEQSKVPERKEKFWLVENSCNIRELEEGRS